MEGIDSSTDRSRFSKPESGIGRDYNDFYNVCDEGGDTEVLRMIIVSMVLTLLNVDERKGSMTLVTSMMSVMSIIRERSMMLVTSMMRERGRWFLPQWRRMDPPVGEATLPNTPQNPPHTVQIHKYKPPNRYKPHNTQHPSKPPVPKYSAVVKAAKSSEMPVTAVINHDHTPQLQD